MNKETLRTIILSQAGFAVMYLMMKYVWIGFSNVEAASLTRDIISMVLITCFIIGTSVMVYASSTVISFDVNKKTNQKKTTKKLPAKA